MGQHGRLGDMGANPMPVREGIEKPREYYSQLLNGIAMNLLALSPWEVEDSDIVELGKILNALYTQAYMDNWPADVQNAILQALSRVAELHDQHRLAEGPFPRSWQYFLTIKQFTPQLQMIAAYLEDGS